MINLKANSEIFGVLFPGLYLTALAMISLVAYDILCRCMKIDSPKEWLPHRLKNIYTLATLLGSLQTTISLCIVGFSLFFGTLELGTKAFSSLIQGFASTAFGLAIAVSGFSYLLLCYPDSLRDQYPNQKYARISSNLLKKLTTYQCERSKV